MLRIALSALALAIPAAEPASGASPEDLRFFETRVRPLLAENCLRCHSGAKPKGGLRLDHVTRALEGGDSGPALVRGEPGKSLLVSAIGYGRTDLRMPPRGKLADAEIGVLVEWVRRGAPWPDEPPPGIDPGAAATFDLEARRRSHWAWRPVEPRDPPPAPAGSGDLGEVDRFIFAKLAERGVEPAPEADPSTLVRRLHFDLAGLPPDPAAAEAYASEPGPGAWERAVDALLASPRFGERWGRHWLDLVRYAETLGHEFDYPIHNAWRYRDYVIRALNADVPYDLFVREHIAGDLLPERRRHPTEGFDESTIGTASLWLGQQTHSPVDALQHQSEVIENQIDVLAKAFLGITVACARCHDHKFDAVSTRDYYSLRSVLASTRYRQAAIDPPAAIADRARALEELRSRLRRRLGGLWAAEAGLAEAYMAACPPGASPDPRLDPARIDAWRKALDATPRRAVEVLLREPAASGPSRRDLLADFERRGYDAWLPDGEALRAGPARAGDLVLGGPVRKGGFAVLPRGAVHTGALSNRLQGALRSPTFTIDRKRIHVRARGKDARVNVVIDGYMLIRSPIYGGLKMKPRPEPGWITFDVEMWQGRAAYIEISDLEVPDPADDERKGYAADGWIAVERVLLSDGAPPEEDGAPQGDAPRAGGDRAVSADLGEAVRRAVEDWAANRPGPPEVEEARAEVIDWMLAIGLLPTEDSEVALLLEERARIEASIPSPTYVPAATDGSAIDGRVHIRGNPRNLGADAPRGFLEALAPGGGRYEGPGSGRLDLARRLTDPSSPLFARVAVNRVWHHLFGRGLVPSVDNLGALGERPSHPELLDWLARRFVDDGYSLKKLVRLLVLTRSYRMSSVTSAETLARDPENALFSRMRVRRLEAEAIRDAILAISSRLDLRMHGPPVPVHLTPFMDGRGRPSASGPVDGDGRRTIYLEVRRNFISPFMLAFDAPTPLGPQGRRTSSNVPAQALILLNGPFVAAEARRWANHALASEAPSHRARIEGLYRTAFGRPPSPDEVSASEELLLDSERARGEGGDAREEVWADLCHALFNAKELEFVP